MWQTRRTREICHGLAPITQHTSGRSKLDTKLWHLDPSSTSQHRWLPQVYGVTSLHRWLPQVCGVTSRYNGSAVTLEHLFEYKRLIYFPSIHVRCTHRARHDKDRTALYNLAGAWTDAIEVDVKIYNHYHVASRPHSVCFVLISRRSSVFYISADTTQSDNMSCFTKTQSNRVMIE